MANKKPEPAPPEEPKANSNEEAVAVSQWGNSRAIAIGNEEKDEWLIAPEAEDLEEAI